MKLEKFIRPFVVPPGKKISLKKDYSPSYTAKLVKEKDATEMLQRGVQWLAEYQDRLYAQSTHALLIIFQAMDAAGKDGTIKHVMSGLNPQGCQVYSFKAPSVEELDHDYNWRHFKALPERGRIGIFNRSYYEEVLAVRVHPAFLAAEKLPLPLKDEGIWNRRFDEINQFERYLVSNGIVVLKFFLNVSKAEQKKRFLERIDQPEKNWKFSAADAKERAFWDDYMQAYQDMLNHTSTKWAPWHIIPADTKWFTRLAVAAVITAKLKEIDPQYPTVDKERKAEMRLARKMLEEEK
ncbi:MAG TPA: polyphosphate kinase 2 family protein [Candidatus Methylomirabilis sp.]|nr:polyphosphate kinase 2 family protein [Candidatus Methylomirabilis sp.]